MVPIYADEEGSRFVENYTSYLAPVHSYIFYLFNYLSFVQIV
jgi:hypothetical protein